MQGGNRVDFPGHLKFSPCPVQRPDPVWGLPTFWVSGMRFQVWHPLPTRKKKISENLLLDLVSKYFLSGQGEHREVPDITVPPVSGPGLCRELHRAGFAVVLPSCRPKGVVWGQWPGPRCIPHRLQKGETRETGWRFRGEGRNRLHSLTSGTCFTAVSPTGARDLKRRQVV